MAVQVSGYSSSQMASAELHLERRAEWHYVRINGVRYAMLPSGRSNHVYTVRADARGCSCRWYTETQRDCSHMLALQMAAEEDAASALLATDTEVDAYMSQSAGQFRREEARREALVSSSRFYEPVQTHGARSLADMAAQAALDEIMRRPLARYEDLFGEAD